MDAGLTPLSCRSERRRAGAGMRATSDSVLVFQKTSTREPGIPFGIPKRAELKIPLRKEMTLKPLIFLDFRHKKRRPWTSLFDHLVEPGGFEPPSASTPLSVLHA